MTTIIIISLIFTGVTVGATIAAIVNAHHLAKEAKRKELIVQERNIKYTIREGHLEEIAA